MIGPKVYPAAPYPQAASLRVNLGETSIEALDASGRIVAFFPCSIAKDKNKRPNGRLVVKSVVPDPDYTFDPALFKDAAAEEHITHKMTLPPGPRNPVGTAWIGLSLPGYGIHGTPEPENISRTPVARLLPSRELEREQGAAHGARGDAGRRGALAKTAGAS